MLDYNFDKIIGPDIKDENIYDVIGRMQVLLDIFNDNSKYSPLIPFLETYFLVTKNVADKSLLKKKYFENYDAIQMLDIKFATLYFKPLYQYLTIGQKHNPWKSYFSYSESDKHYPITQLLLGINSHINADLPKALYETKYKSQKDFFIVNDVLMEVIPEVMKFLLTKHDLVGVGGIIFKNFILNEFHQIIERWRSEAWANYQLKTNEKIIISKTEETGIKIIKLIDEIYSLRNPSKIIELNNLSINL